MDFFQAQEQARKQTTRLVFLFALAVIALVIATNIVVMLSLGFLHSESGEIDIAIAMAQFNWNTFFTIGALVVGVIAIGSLFKMMALSGGGSTVANSLGGRLISQYTEDFYERRILNVVEEMAIASGTPVPPVYLLDDEDAINAFAAGHGLSDAVIGVTQGAVERLTREELQGVIGHEFSHILNGDMRLNLRLIGLLHGILLIGQIGEFILRSTRHRSSSSKKEGNPLIGIGIGLFIIGYAGTFFGKMIKASVSRQREYLADASAVQFTRSNIGIAGALKRIGGHVSGSMLSAPDASMMSHGYFANGVKTYWQSLFATHPPLTKRIRRLEPGWDGRYPEAKLISESDDNSQQADSEAKKSTAILGAVAAVPHLISQIGQTSQDQLIYAAELISEIPAALRDAVKTKNGAQAVFFYLVVMQQKLTLDEQLARSGVVIDEKINMLLRHLLKQVPDLAVKYRLPLMDMALTTLRLQSREKLLLQHAQLDKLVRADGACNLFEWALCSLFATYLQLNEKTHKHNKRLERLGQPVATLLSTLLATTKLDVQAQDDLFSSVVKEFDLPESVQLRREELNLSKFSAALMHLQVIRVLEKPRLLKACLAILTHDKDYSAPEIELMRAISAVLDCPMPIYRVD